MAGSELGRAGRRCPRGTNASKLHLHKRWAWPASFPTPGVGKSLRRVLNGSLLPLPSPTTAHAFLVLPVTLPGYTIVNDC